LIILSSEVIINAIPQVAVGTETVEGYKMLSHLELCEFYPALIAALRTLSAGATEALLSPQQLPFLDHYPMLIKVSHKGHAFIYQSLFAEIRSDSCEMSLKVVQKIASLVAEGYAGTFREQAECYLDDGKFKLLLEADPNSMNGVPTNALAVEHQVSILEIES